MPEFRVFIFRVSTGLHSCRLFCKSNQFFLFYLNTSPDAFAGQDAPKFPQGRLDIDRHGGARGAQSVVSLFSRTEAVVLVHILKKLKFNNKTSILE